MNYCERHLGEACQMRSITHLVNLTASTRGVLQDSCRLNFQAAFVT